MSLTLIFIRANYTVFNSNRTRNSPSVEWSDIQTLFEKANIDTPLLLDCCSAINAAPRVGLAVTETIAACGFETWAPLPGAHSFTAALTDILEDKLKEGPFSAASLHQEILLRIKQETPGRARDGKRRKLEHRRTPIHVIAAADMSLSSIELSKRIPPLSTTSSKVPSINTDPQASSTTPTEAENLHAVTGDTFKTPHVLMSLALEGDQTLNAESWSSWLSSCPSLVKYTKLEGIYKSY